MPLPPAGSSQPVFCLFLHIPADCIPSAAYPLGISRYLLRRSLCRLKTPLSTKAASAIEPALSTGILLRSSNRAFACSSLFLSLSFSSASEISISNSPFRLRRRCLLPVTRHLQFVPLDTKKGSVHFSACPVFLLRSTTVTFLPMCCVLTAFMRQSAQHIISVM